uniref:Uncharacterized protein n=1 Tax=Sphaerodactylus townsendi TaxID=933632 RepID=A0ACB8FBQ1_9SAUR
MIVTSLTVDDLISVVPVTIFMLKQWLDEMLPHTLCTTSALLYLFQGFSSNLMGSLVVSYNFYSLHKTGTSHRATKRPVSMIWAILTIWIVSLLICILPLFGWGSYSPTSWGCLMDCASSYVLLLFGIYVLCLCLLVVLSIPLIYKLLCSDDQQQLYDDYHQIVRGYFSPGSPPAGSHALSLSPEDPVNRLSKHCQVPCQNSDPLVRQSPTDISGADHYGAHCVPYTSRGFTVEFAQKRFSLILALIKVILWLPMMNIGATCLAAVSLTAGGMSTPSPHKKASTQLGAVVISDAEIWKFTSPTQLVIHQAKGIILRSHVWWLTGDMMDLLCSCLTGPILALSNAIVSFTSLAKRRGFEFNLSFQQGYGIYKISHDIYHSDDGNSVSYHSLLNYDCENAKETQKENNTIEFSTISLEDSSILKDSAKRNRTVGTDTKQDLGKDKVTDHLLAVKTGTHKREDIRNMEKGPFFEGPERRLSHEECRKPELSDWEWCRSKSERTPRQVAFCHCFILEYFKISL